MHAKRVKVVEQMARNRSYRSYLEAKHQKWESNMKEWQKKISLTMRLKTSRK